ncbi:MAG: FHA domain-containing protein [Kofleriaceae bacterium]
MARGTSTSGRAPAHLSVVPGGAGGLDDLEDDRTTIEPAPVLAHAADEAPTPIAPAGGLAEQWEDGTTVAEPSGTSSRSAIVEESTIEETARPLPPLQLVPSTPAADPASRAKLTVLAGPDQDREFAIGPGLEVRIGRAVDNDVVLTDIAVSRKHLALSWETDAWVIQDNGSGNGTLVNDRLEDGRCQLHHGDRIEIGNTIFRFDHLPSAQQGAVASWGQRDEEAATVAGKAPVRPSEVAAAAIAPAPRRHRPASVTAPVQDRALRKRPGATEPPPPPPRSRAKTAPPPVPRVTTAAPASPPPPQATPAPILFAPPSQPAMRAAPPQLLTSPGPVPVAPSGPVPMPLSGPYTAPGPTFGPGASGAYAAPYGGAVRPMTTTAQVEPRAYAPMNPYLVARGRPQRSRKGMWIAMGVVALASVAVAGAMLGGDAPAPTAAGGAGPAQPAPAGAITPTEPTPTEPTPTEPTPTEPTSTEAAPGIAAGTAPEAAVTPGAPTPPTPDPVVTPVPGDATAPAVPPPVEPPIEVAVTRPPTPDPTPDRTPTPKPKPPERVAKITSPGRVVVAEPKPAPAPAPKGLAAAAKKAEGLYKAKDFKGAAATLRDAIGTSTEGDAKSLKARASAYDTVGNNLTAAAGMGSQRATEALTAYKRAMAADRQAGGAHQLSIRDKIASVAPRAAALYMARQSYELAKSAADDAVNVGVGGTSMVTGVRASLERRAGEFYATASKLQKSKPAEAKALARRITKMVPGDSPWYRKAVALVNGSSSSRDDDE